MAPQRATFLFHLPPQPGVPGTGREMTHDDPQAGLVCQFLQLPFPQTQAGAVTAATMAQPLERAARPRRATFGSNQQACRIRIGDLAHGSPP